MYSKCPLPEVLLYLPLTVGQMGEGEKEEGDGCLQYLLATDSGQLQVFLDSTLKWSATLPHPPTDLSVATFMSVSSPHSLHVHSRLPSSRTLDRTQNTGQSQQYIVHTCEILQET